MLILYSFLFIGNCYFLNELIIIACWFIMVVVILKLFHSDRDWLKCRITFVKWISKFINAFFECINVLLGIKFKIIHFFMKDLLRKIYHKDYYVFMFITRRIRLWLGFEVIFSFILELLNFGMSYFRFDFNESFYYNFLLSKSSAFYTGSVFNIIFRKG